MGTHNSNWFSYDFAKKTSILKLMSKEIIFGKDGKDKPLIIWELPWNTLYALDTGSNMKAWHAQRFHIGTFLTVPWEKAKLQELRLFLAE
jgi:hypothetical protein